MPLIITMMVAFVVAALGFILAAEFVRRRTSGPTNRPVARRRETGRCG
jgi:hypothetical protein